MKVSAGPRPVSGLCPYFLFLVVPRSLRFQLGFVYFLGIVGDGGAQETFLAPN